jgi:hypothetical protein
LSALVALCFQRSVLLEQGVLFTKEPNPLNQAGGRVPRH